MKGLPEAGIALMPGVAPLPATSVAGPVAITIPITIGPEGDPDRLRSILLEVAKQQAGVEATPAPEVKFDSFESDGLKLLLVVHVTSGTASDAIKTDLAFAVHRAMRAAGIENAMHRHNVRLSDLEPVRQAVLAAMEERRRNMGAEGKG